LPTDDEPLVIHGWTIFAHPLFLVQFEELLMQVEQLRQKYPSDDQKKNATKRLAAIARLAFDKIPQNPGDRCYYQGNTLGKVHRHWFRAKFFQEYRLFFRYHQDSKIIVYTWVNDEGSKRAYKSKTDAYETFKKMLEINNPPRNWDELLEQAKESNDRLKESLKESFDLDQ
jgi:toxin YhaV